MIHMDHNSERQNLARQAVGSPQASIAAHGKRIETFNLEIRQNSTIRKRAFVLSASLGLHHASGIIGAVMGTWAQVCPALKGRGGAVCRQHHQSSSSDSMVSVPITDGAVRLSLVPLLASGCLCGAGLAMVLTVNCMAERYVYNLEYQRELWEIQNHMDGERQEMIEIYGALGLNEADAAVVTDIFASDSSRFAQLMMVEELGYSRLPPPLLPQTLIHAALPSAAGYALGVVVPLLPLCLSNSVMPLLRGALRVLRPLMPPSSSPSPQQPAATTVSVDTHYVLALSILVLVCGCVAEGAARSAVFLGSYAENRTRFLAALSTLTGASVLLGGAFYLTRVFYR